MKTIHRLRGRKSFDAVRSARNVFNGEFLRFVYDLQPGRSRSIRLGVIVGGHHGRATRRNLLKRRIREACREKFGSLAPKLEEKQTILSVVVMFRGFKGRIVEDVSYANVRNEAEEFAGMIQDQIQAKWRAS